MEGPARNSFDGKNTTQQLNHPNDAMLTGSGSAAANLRRAAAIRKIADDGDLLDHRCGRLGTKRNRSNNKVDGRVDTARQRRHEDGKKMSCTTLTAGPLQVSSVALQPYAHGELYRRCVAVLGLLD